MKKEKVINFIASILLLTGMIAFISYVVYAAIGNYLWYEYNPITTDISSLSAVGAPNQEKLSPFLGVYGASLFVFVITYMAWTFNKKRHICVKIGSILLFLMAMVSKFGYSLFPLEGDKTQMTFQNSMHIVTTVFVVFLSIAALYLIAVGYQKRDETKKIGKVIIILATIFTVCGMTNPIGMGMNLNVLGLTERLAIYSLHFTIGIIGLWEAKQAISNLSESKR